MSFSIDDPNKPAYASRRKSFKALDELGSNHWRQKTSKKFVDYSKRTIRNPYCIHPENCVDGPRKRKRVIYDENAYWKSVLTGKDIESIVSTKKNKQRGPKSSRKKAKIENITKEDLSQKITEETAKQTESVSSILDKEVLKHIERLGGKISNSMNPRVYINYTTSMPPAIQAFCDVQWEHACFDSMKYRVEVEFSGEFALDRSEIADVPLLHKNGIKSDYILIGDGTTLIVARNNDLSPDPIIYLASNTGVEHELYNAPIKLSEFLSTLEIDRTKSPSMFATD